MAKNNYTKVEEALAEGLRKMRTQELLEIADRAKAGKGTPSKSEAHLEKGLLKALHLDLQYLHKHGGDPYTKLGINKGEIAKYIEHPEDLTDEEWQKIHTLKEQLETYKQELDKLPKSTDEEIVKDQQKKQKTKRFNVRDHWLPLQ